MLFVDTPFNYYPQPQYPFAPEAVNGLLRNKFIVRGAGAGRRGRFRCYFHAWARANGHERPLSPALRAARPRCPAHRRFAASWTTSTPSSRRRAGAWRRS